MKLPVAGVAYFRPHLVTLPQDILQHPRYIRPPSQPHFLWRDLYDSLSRGQHAVTQWLEEGFRRLGFTPAMPHVGELVPDETEEVKENQRNFGKLWHSTRALASQAWKVGRGRRCELYLYPVKLAGDIEVDTSLEDLYTHGAPKTAIAMRLASIVSDADLGEVCIDSTRVRSRFAALSVEPDIAVVLKGPDRYIGLDGADLIVEVVSDSSVKKDLERLPPLYAAAHVPELWLVDARSEGLRFDILELKEGRYLPVAADSEGWTSSPQLGRLFRLIRQRKPRLGAWRYRLESRETSPAS